MLSATRIEVGKTVSFPAGVLADMLARRAYPRHLGHSNLARHLPFTGGVTAQFSREALHMCPLTILSIEKLQGTSASVL